MFQTILENLSLSLEKRGIAYMIIGGQAVLLYGNPRLTKDIDITVGLGPDDLSKIIEVSEELQYEILVDSPESFVSKTNVLPCSEPETGIRIDFIFSYSEYEKLAFTRVKNINIGNANVCFASLEDIVIHKIIAGRARDIEDVKSMLLKNKNIDREYIDKWLQDFDSSLSQSFLQRFYDIWRESN